MGSAGLGIGKLYGSVWQFTTSGPQLLLEVALVEAIRLSQTTVVLQVIRLMDMYTPASHPHTRSACTTRYQWEGKSRSSSNSSSGEVTGFLLMTVIVSWRSAAQKLTATSSPNAEYISLASYPS